MLLADIARGKLPQHQHVFITDVSLQMMNLEGSGVSITGLAPLCSAQAGLVQYCEKAKTLEVSLFCVCAWRLPKRILLPPTPTSR